MGFNSAFKGLTVVTQDNAIVRRNLVIIPRVFIPWRFKWDNVINQLDAQNFCFTISLFHASTCFEHHVLIISRSKLYYTASGIITPIGGRLVHRCTAVHETATYKRDDTRGCIIQF